MWSQSAVRRIGLISKRIFALVVAVDGEKTYCYGITAPEDYAMGWVMYENVLLILS